MPPTDQTPFSPLSPPAARAPLGNVPPTDQTPFHDDVPPDADWRGALTIGVRAHIREYIASFERVRSLAKRDSATLRSVVEEVLGLEPLVGVRRAFGIAGAPKRWQHYAQCSKKSGGVAYPWLNHFMQAVRKEAESVGIRVEPDSGALRVVGVPAIRKLKRSAKGYTWRAGEGGKPMGGKRQKVKGDDDEGLVGAARGFVAMRGELDGPIGCLSDGAGSPESPSSASSPESPPPTDGVDNAAYRAACESFYSEEMCAARTLAALV